jgi:hypothetical protein
MSFPPFDRERDCAQDDVVQDIKVQRHEHCISIWQHDGTGDEDGHVIVVPNHAIAAFRNAVFGLKAEQEQVISGVEK